MEFQFPGFKPEARQFLRELAANNNRAWFKPRKSDYEQYVRGPLIELTWELGIALSDFAEGYRTDARKAVYRIYRDVRFSRNKDPYKTHAAAIFPPLGLDRHAGAGFYFHFSADELFVGGGVYAPGSAELRLIRERIARDHGELRAIVAASDFKRAFGGIAGATLKRIPQGFPRDHAAADLLVRKQFLAAATLPAAEIEKPTIAAVLNRHFRMIAPFLAFLNEPLRPS